MFKDYNSKLAGRHLNLNYCGRKIKKKLYLALSYSCKKYKIF